MYVWLMCVSEILQEVSGVFRSPYQAHTGNDSSRTTECADSTPFSEAAALARQNVPLPYSISVGDLQEELKRRFCCSEAGLEPLLSENESENSPMMDLEYLESEKMARWKKVYYRSFKIST